MITSIIKKRRWSYWLRRGLFWVIPVVVLYVVFRQIDLSVLRASVAQTNPWLVAMGIGSFPVIVLIGALRWHLLLLQYIKRTIDFSFVLEQYWIGLALGIFAPASVGWDAYRVLAAGRRLGEYSLNAAIIVVEKLMALITCATLTVALYPVVPITMPMEGKSIFHAAYAVLLGSILSIAVIAFALRNRALSMMVERLEGRIENALMRVGRRFGLDAKADYARVPLRAMIEPLTVPKQVLAILVISFSIQLVAAVRNHILFRAIGYDLPLSVNLFVVPVLAFVFLLPISFGSLGIREGAFILLYGLFGAPAEIALLVSLFNLSGLLLNNLIGGLIMLLSNVRGEGLPVVFRG